MWAIISNSPVVGGGSIRPVEAVSDSNFKDELDLLAGIDAWQVQCNPSAIRGIASRVQWGEAHDSFTVRTRLPSGKETEFQKRHRAILSIDNGHLFPHLTIQAYLDVRGGNLLSAATIRTVDLIRAAFLLVENKDRLNFRPDFYGFISNSDGTEFLYMKWCYLEHKRLLKHQDVVHQT